MCELFYVKLFLCTEFRHKVFGLLECSAFQVRRMAKDVLIIKHTLQGVSPNQQSAAENHGSARIEVIVLTSIVWNEC